jgi:hypothetical protein
MMNRLKHSAVLAAFTALLTVTACGHGTPAQSQADVRKAAAGGARAEAEARLDAAWKIDEARRQLAKAQNDVATVEVGATRYVTVAEAEAAYKVAIARCAAQSSDSRAPCEKRADMELAAAKVHADASRAVIEPKA